MTNYPTAINPLILNYRGRVPALKNNKVPITGKDGKLKLIPSSDVEAFVKKCRSMQSQVEKQGFEMMRFPQPVACHVDLYFAIQEKHGIPTSDGDNAFTTIQETWQDPNRARAPLGAVLGVLEDDRQILSCAWEIWVVPNKMLEGAKAFLWGINGDISPRQQRKQFDEWYEVYQTRLAFVEDETLDFADFDNLF